MRANGPKQCCPGLRYLIPGVVLQLMVIEEVLSSHSALGRCDDIRFSILGRVASFIDNYVTYMMCIEGRIPLAQIFKFI